MKPSFIKKVVASVGLFGVLATDLASAASSLPYMPTISSYTGGCIFTDVCNVNDPYYTAIAYLKDKNLIKGNPDGSFGVDREINRAEVITLAFRGFSKDIVYSSQYSFPDVPKDAWYAPSISTAKKEGFVSGNPDGTYRPANPVNMAEASKIFLKFYNAPLPTVSKGYVDPLQSGGLDYSEDPNAWFNTYIKLVQDFNLLQHKGGTAYVRPETAMLRKDVALMLYNLLLAKEDISAPLSLLSAWNENNSNISEGVPIYFYFSKPVDISKVGSFSTVKVDGVVTKNVTFTQGRWGDYLPSFNPAKAGVEESYKYRLHELQVSSPLFTVGRKVSIDIVQGLPDIYGTTLPQAQSFAYTIAPAGGYIDLGGKSYFLSHTPKTLLLGQKGNSQITAYLCTVSLDTYLQNFQYNSELDTMDRTVTREYFMMFGRQVESQMKNKCSDVKKATFDPKDVPEVVKEVDLEKVFSTSLKGGIYYVYFASPEVASKSSDPSRSKNHKFIYVSDTSVTMKLDENGYNAKNMFLWVTDTQNSTVRANTKVDIYSTNAGGYSENGTYQMKKITTVTTNADGVARTVLTTPTPDTLVAVVQSDNHFGVVTSQWNDGLESWEYNLPWQPEAYGKTMDQYVIHSFTDRKIYRPGHTVELKGFIREKTTAGLKLPALKQVEVIVNNPEYKEVTSFVAEVTSQGTFAGSYLIPENASTGSYSLAIKNPKPGEGSYDLETTTFQVEEYRKPDFRVSLEGLKSDYMSGESLNVAANVAYYFGSKVDKGYYNWTLERDTLYWQPSTDQWYSFSDSGFCGWYCSGASEQVSYGNGDIVNGTISIGEKLDLSDVAHGGLYTLTVEAYDQNDRRVTERQTFRVHKSSEYVGVRTVNYMVQEGTAPSFDVLTVQKNGDVLPNKSVQVDLYTEEWTSVEKVDVSGTHLTENTSMQKKVDTKMVTTDAKGKAMVQFSPQKPGSYYAIATITDAQGRVNKAREYSYVYSAKDASSYVAWPMDDALKMNILADKPTYEIGANMNLLVQSPYQTSKVLVTFEKDSILDYYVMDMKNNTSPLTFPIKASYAPNVYVNVIAQNAGGDAGMRMGYANISVNTEQLTMGVTMTADKQKYKPGDTVRLEFQTKDFSGKGVPAELSVAVVDESVIALAGGVDRDIVNAFYSLKNLGIATAHSLTHYVKESILRTAGGGGKGGNSGLPQVRGNMKDTAYWNARVTTDASGKGVVTFTLPDNLTRWEVLAQGATTTNLFGSDAIEIETTQDLVVLPVLPRFVRKNDTVHVAYTLYNTTAQADTLTVSLASPDMANLGAPKTVQIASFGSANVAWDVKIPSTLSALTLVATADGAKLDDALSLTLPVEEQSIPDIVMKSMTVNGSATMDVAVPTGATFTADRGGLHVIVSPGLLSRLKDDMKYLLSYPYGCSEQLVSSTFPNVLVKKYIKEYGKSLDGISFADVDTRVYAGLQKLYANQAVSGAFTLWGDDNDTYNTVYLTAYVVDFMLLTKSAGYTVDPTVLQNAKTFLGSKLGSSSSFANDDEYLYAAHMYQKLGGTNIESYINGVLAKNSALTPSLMARVIMMYTDLGKTTEATKWKNSLVAKVTKDGDVWHVEIANPNWYYAFNYDEMKVNSLIAEALLLRDANDETAPHIISWLMNKDDASIYPNTHTKAYMLRAVLAYLSTHAGSSSPMNVTVTVNGKETAMNFAEGAFSSAQNVTYPMAEVKGKASVKVSGPAGTSVFVQNTLTYLDPTQASTAKLGLALSRRVYKVDSQGNRTLFTGSAKVGDMFVVQITTRKDGTRKLENVAIEDHLPAGLEVLNPRLRQQNPITIDTGYTAKTEYLDDRIFMNVLNAESDTYEYMAQAIAAGSFTFPSVYAYEMYDPAKYARGMETTMIVK